MWARRGRMRLGLDSRGKWDSWEWIRDKERKWIRDKERKWIRDKERKWIRDKERKWDWENEKDSKTREKKKKKTHTKVLFSLKTFYSQRGKQENAEKEDINIIKSLSKSIFA